MLDKIEKNQTRAGSLSLFSAGFRNRCSAGVPAGMMALRFAGVAAAQDDKDWNGSDTNGAAAQATQTYPLNRPIPETRKRVRAMPRKTLSETYRKWLDEDVYWIITDEERSAFLQLWNDDEHDHFIEAFWQRRLYG
ncbi:MAG: hypothetical protein WBV36_18185, partial [Terriglobales bacterium]